MASEEHLERIHRGVEVWNAWRSEFPETRPNLFRADLHGCDLAGANLHHVDLRRANLQGADLQAANLSEAYLLGVNFQGAKLQRANLRGALLREANLSESDLSEADLSEAYLSDADLSRSQLFLTKLDRTRLTGACLEDWHIDRPSCLNLAICEYIYLKQQQQECRPRLGRFAPGELAQLFQKIAATIELVFSDGIDWEAFLTVLEKVNYQISEGDIYISGLEESDSGTFVVRLKIPSQSDKKEIKKIINKKYLDEIDSSHITELESDRRAVELHRQKSANLMEIARVMSQRQV